MPQQDKDATPGFVREAVYLGSIPCNYLNVRCYSFQNKDLGGVIGREWPVKVYLLPVAFPKSLSGYIRKSVQRNPLNCQYPTKPYMDGFANPFFCECIIQ